MSPRRRATGRRRTKAADWFLAGLEVLRAYVERHGTARAPRHARVGNFLVGRWVQRRRADYRNDRLSAERIRLLAVLPGWTWAPLEDDFQEGLRHARKSAARFGHTRIPKEYQSTGFRLGHWVQNRREEYRAGHLATSRIRLLQALHDWSWQPIEDGFAANLALLRRFAKREGHARVPLGHHEAGTDLGVWVNASRLRYKRGNLNRSWIPQLEAVPGWTWTPLQDQFSTGAQLARQFAKREGHLRVHQHHREGGFPLGEWVGKLRVKHRKGRLSAEIVRTLQKLPGWTWNPVADDFERSLTAARVFARREGHCRVPNHHREAGVRLGKWLASCRQRFQACELSPGRIRALEALPGWSWTPTTDAFQRGLDAMRTFAAREGHVNVPARHCENGLVLGRWVRKQRREYARAQLRPERRHALDGLPGWSWG